VPKWSGQGWSGTSGPHPASPWHDTPIRNGDCRFWDSWAYTGLSVLSRVCQWLKDTACTTEIMRSDSVSKLSEHITEQQDKTRGIHKCTWRHWAILRDAVRSPQRVATRLYTDCRPWSMTTASSDGSPSQIHFVNDVMATTRVIRCDITLLATLFGSRVTEYRFAHH